MMMDAFLQADWTVRQTKKIKSGFPASVLVKLDLGLQVNGGSIKANPE